VLGIYICWMCGFRSSHVNNVVCVILLISCARGLEWLYLQKEALCFSNSVYRDERFYDKGKTSLSATGCYSCTATVESLQVTLTIRTIRSVNTHTSLNKLWTEICVLSLYILTEHKLTIIINKTQSLYTRRWY
jgi:hypothetical protein